MTLWCDKHRPDRFAKLDYNLEQVDVLKRLIAKPNFPHLCICGPPGSGKSTRVRALLHELFGPGALHFKIEHRVIETASQKLEFSFLASNFHIEVCPAKAGFQDRVVIQNLIKEFASVGTISKTHAFKVVVITEADSLSREAQQGLRRTFEKYSTSTRVILVAELASKLIPALRSRCLTIRNAAPSVEEITTILNTLVDIESVKISEAELANIIKKADRNLRRAMLSLEMYAAQLRYPIDKSKGNALARPRSGYRWIDIIEDMVNVITKPHTMIKKIVEYRAKLFDLQNHLVPSQLVLRMLLLKIYPFCANDQIRSMVTALAGDADHRIALGSKHVIHLERFIIGVVTLFHCKARSVPLKPEDLEIKI